MIEVLQFIFQDFWHWLGAVILLAIPFSAISGLVTVIVNREPKQKP